MSVLLIVAAAGILASQAWSALDVRWPDGGVLGVLSAPRSSLAAAGSAAAVDSPLDAASRAAAASPGSAAFPASGASMPTARRSPAPSGPGAAAPAGGTGTAPPASTPHSVAAPPGGAGRQRSGGASASRLALLVPCPGRTGCYVYTVRAGDNLWSIARWFGVPMGMLVELNPWISAAHPICRGDHVVMPRPTR